MFRRLFVLFSVCIFSFAVCGFLSGCSKDVLLGAYNRALQVAGEQVLTADPHGERRFGTDSYAGTYKVTLENATIRERLFGNTSVERSDGYHFEIRADFDAESGIAALELQHGSDDPEILFSGTGRFEKEVDLGPGSDYFILDTDEYTGEISLSIK